MTKIRVTTEQSGTTVYLEYSGAIPLTQTTDNQHEAEFENVADGSTYKTYLASGDDDKIVVTTHIIT